MPSYQITEPHPTAPPNHRIHTGRGGAGNTIRVAPASSSSASTRTTSSTSTSPMRSKTKASTGRGGAGNIYPSTSLSHFSLSDEMDAQAARERGHELWHVGRGGAGNFASTPNSSARKMSSGSEDSDGSTRSGFFGRLSGAFERR